MAVSPKSYTVTDKDGNVVGTVTAEDANSYINPSEVEAAIAKVGEVAETEMQSITSALNALSDDADQAVIVQGTKMTETINEVGKALGELPASFVSSLSDMQDAAQKAHDEIQEQLNEQARSAAASKASAAGGSYS